MPLPGPIRYHVLIGLLIATVVAAGWLTLRTPRAVPTVKRSASVELPGPPWRYGRSDARFTLVVYADLECPYCRDYFPTLKRWIDTNRDVNWQWHHLPLTMHEPIASAEARLAECAGEAGGPVRFWHAVTWLYRHTRGDGQGLPEGVRYPGLTPAVQACLDSDRPDAVIRSQVADAQHHGITATPTLQLRDRATGKTLRLQGPVDGDALLSALDLLAAGEPSADESSLRADMPAGLAGDMPR